MQIQSPNSNLLSASIKMRELHNITNSLYMPKKGNIDEVQNGQRDKKGGPLLIKYAFNARGKEKIGKIPETDECDSSTPDILQPTPTVRRFIDMNMNVESTDINYQWCSNAKNVIQCLNVQSDNRFKNRIHDHMEQFNSQDV